MNETSQKTWIEQLAKKNPGQPNTGWANNPDAKKYKPRPTKHTWESPHILSKTTGAQNWKTALQETSQREYTDGEIPFIDMKHL